MTNLVVTGEDLQTQTVTLAVPHGDLLAQIGVALAYWQQERERVSESMAVLRAAGVFLDAHSEAILPSWWERANRPSHYYLVWPAAYARQEGLARRQRIEAKDYQELEDKRRRTLEYANLQATDDRMRQRIEEVGQVLTKLAKKDHW